MKVAVHLLYFPSKCALLAQVDLIYFSGRTDRLTNLRRCLPTISGRMKNVLVRKKEFLCDLYADYAVQRPPSVVDDA